MAEVRRQDPTVAQVDRECVPDLRKERANCNFNIEEMITIVDGGEEKTAIRRELERLFLSDKELHDDIPPEYLSHEERYSNELRKACYIITKLVKEGGRSRKMMGSLGEVRGIMKDGNPLALHVGMFIPAIMGQGNGEQQQRWLGLCLAGRIIGTYAQTEMGHGTFLRGLETTATYDPESQEFVLHSPTITATKWWPGSLGKTANYAVVMAQLYTQGQCHGPHPFIVQLRDENTHASLPGVTLGEIGPRLGLNTNDNGFLRFDHYRIPRMNMLMKNSQVLEDGTYVKPMHTKLAYGTMVAVRVGIVKDSYKQLQKAVTIATRYSAVRHQSELEPGAPEPQILDYQTQQYKLLPQITAVFAFVFSAENLYGTYVAATAKIAQSNTELLPELHALSSGLKALSSYDAANGIEVCRLACGGHGYLTSSNLPRLYSGTTCGITYEGENTVLYLQVARYIIKSYRAAAEGKHLQGSVAYLMEDPTAIVSGGLSNKALIEAYRKSVLTLIGQTEGRLQRLCDMGQEFHHAWNNSSVLLVKCAEAHTRYFTCKVFVDKVESMRATEGVQSVMQSLCRLYLIHHIILNQGDFLRSGSLTGDNVAVLESEMCDLLALLRPQAVCIVDAFDIPDILLNSTLGAWDGNVYQRLYDEALKSPLNRTDVPEAYYKYLQPMMKANL